MEALTFDLKPRAGPDADGAGSRLILLKLLLLDDFRDPYGGTGLALAGAAVASDPAGGGGAPRFGFPPSRAETLHLLDLADEFLSRPDGYGPAEGVFGLFARALLGSGSEPLAFLAAAEHRRRFEAFLSRVERECLRPDPRSRPKGFLPASPTFPRRTSI